MKNTGRRKFLKTSSTVVAGSALLSSSPFISIGKSQSELKIGLVGFGVVGKAAYATFSKKFEMVRYDKYIVLDDFESELNTKTPC